MLNSDHSVLTEIWPMGHGILRLAIFGAGQFDFDRFLDGAHVVVAGLQLLVFDSSTLRHGLPAPETDLDNNSHKFANVRRRCVCRWAQDTH